MSSKIASELEAFNIGGTGTPDNKKQCTVNRAKDLGCLIEDSNYLNNRLVPKNILGESVITIVLSPRMFQRAGNWNWSFSIVNYIGPLFKGDLIINAIPPYGSIYFSQQDLQDYHSNLIESISEYYGPSEYFYNIPEQRIDTSIFNVSGSLSPVHCIISRFAPRVPQNEFYLSFTAKPMTIVRTWFDNPIWTVQSHTYTFEFRDTTKISQKVAGGTFPYRLQSGQDNDILKDSGDNITLYYQVNDGPIIKGTTRNLSAGYIEISTSV